MIELVFTLRFVLKAGLSSTTGPVFFSFLFFCAWPNIPLLRRSRLCSKHIFLYNKAVVFLPFLRIHQKASDTCIQLLLKRGIIGNIIFISFYCLYSKTMGGHEIWYITMQNYTWAVGILPYRNTALHFSLICPGIET